LLANLQQYFPALAGLRGEAADVGIELQSALAGLQQQLNLPFISSVLAPYQQNVAGQVTRGQSTQTESNPLAKLGLLSELSQAMESSKLRQQQIAQQGEGNALGWAQLAAQIQQNQAENQFGYAQLGQAAQEAQMQNALGLGNLDVARGGLAAQLARLTQEGQQFSTSQQNNMDIAKGNWANQLAQIVAQGRFNLMGKLPTGEIRDILGLPPLTDVMVEDVFGEGPTIDMGDTSGVTKWYGDPAALARINGVSLDEARLHVAAGQSR